MKLNHIYQGNALDILKKMPNNSIDCCITSPPYYGLRDYGTATWIGGDENCDHLIDRSTRLNFSPKQQTNSGSTGDQAVKNDSFCPKCGAYRQDQQIGLEKTPEIYISKLVEIFNEIKRVLKPTGTLWLNIGDSYCGSGVNDGKTNAGISNAAKRNDVKTTARPNTNINGIKPKDLIGIPWLLAFALRNAGWYLRADIIWHKPNPMPESVTDRPTKSHEYIFLLSKSPQYFYDYQAILEPAAYDGRNDTMFKGGQKYKDMQICPGPTQQSFLERGHERWPNKITGRTETKMNGTGHGEDGSGFHGHGGNFDKNGNSLINQFEDGAPARNKRSVWTITTKPYSEAHFATFPEKLIEPCIKAGTSEIGCCGKCGNPYERSIQKSGGSIGHGSWTKHNGNDLKMGMLAPNTTPAKQLMRAKDNPYKVKTIGWQPTCNCNAAIVPPVVLDPFMGAGTTALVARKLGRNYIGIELNKNYIKIAEKRLYNELGMFV